VGPVVVSTCSLVVLVAAHAVNDSASRIDVIGFMVLLLGGSLGILFCRINGLLTGSERNRSPLRGQQGLNAPERQARRRRSPPLAIVPGSMGRTGRAVKHRVWLIFLSQVPPHEVPQNGIVP
jgi:hypothetical protein